MITATADNKTQIARLHVIKPGSAINHSSKTRSHHINIKQMHSINYLSNHPNLPHPMPANLADDSRHARGLDVTLENSKKL